MLFEWLLDIGTTIFDFFNGMLIDLPQVPTEVTDIVDWFLGMIEDSLDLLAVFVDFRVLKVVLPVALVVINLERVYLVIMWIARKVPVVGIE